ncbi:hypothetical protein [Micrococcus luteus]|uniref:hypothetical protein n=1 Tax=Micrococcus luteus TaxID=1270 RepID=UPI0019D102F2|nr:hypothetical protein [Micrococcus luteus]MBN6749591.1 hypothetical protein [Micrococcus luteus]MBN6759694.1 hypothetical protein [Micrococcus luteus]MBN6801225.1 hypothetical protein [Micrococcus luteus]MCV7565209.1 hypothetical protein [Micrococcus luteus]MCV7574164.1 hypothetical protein [Micrococcus luteus]
MNTSLTQIALDGMVVGNIFNTINELTSEATIAMKAIIVLFGVVVFVIGALAAKGKTAGTIMAGIGGAFFIWLGLFGVEWLAEEFGSTVAGVLLV